MEYFYLLGTFAFIHWLAAASPGPNMVLVTSHSVTLSRRAGFLLAIGIVSGTVTWSVSAALGLGILVAKLPMIYTIIQYIGAIYLIWLGYGMLRDGWRNQYADMEMREAKRASPLGLIAKGYLVNMTNPKSIVYWTSLYSVFIPAGSPVWVFVAAGCIALVVSLAWWFSVAAFFSIPVVRNGFLSVRRYLDFLTGGALVFLGLRLAATR